MAVNDPIQRGTAAWREAQARRYARPGLHVVTCRYCGRDVAETRQDATRGVCTTCVRQGLR